MQMVRDTLMTDLPSPRNPLADIAVTSIQASLSLLDLVHVVNKS